MSTAGDLRRRWNPRGLSVTDVIAGESWRLDRRMLRMYRRRDGAAQWSRAKCWVVVWLSVVGLGLLVVSCWFAGRR